MTEVDSSGWSGEGDFTAVLLRALQEMGGLRFVRVEDAPSSRAEAGYNFVANEIYIGFEQRMLVEPVRLLGIIPVRRRRRQSAMSLEGLERQLASIEGIGPADYADEGMLQYLRVQRVIPPYQKRGYKIVEMVRVYGSMRRDATT
ncbi:MAG: hypothetical protein ACE148_09190 [Vicinamibacterales bacterium]